MGVELERQLDIFTLKYILNYYFLYEFKPIELLELRELTHI